MTSLFEMEAAARLVLEADLAPCEGPRQRAAVALSLALATGEGALAESLLVRLLATLVAVEASLYGNLTKEIATSSLLDLGNMLLLKLGIGPKHDLFELKIQYCLLKARVLADQGLFFNAAAALDEVQSLDAATPTSLVRVTQAVCELQLRLAQLPAARSKVDELHSRVGEIALQAPAFTDLQAKLLRLEGRDSDLEVLCENLAKQTGASESGASWQRLVLEAMRRQDPQRLVAEVGKGRRHRQAGPLFLALMYAALWAPKLAEKLPNGRGFREALAKEDLPHASWRFVADLYELVFTALSEGDIDWDGLIRHWDARAKLPELDHEWIFAALLASWGQKHKRWVLAEIGTSTYHGLSTQIAGGQGDGDPFGIVKRKKAENMHPVKRTVALAALSASGVVTAVRTRRHPQSALSQELLDRYCVKLARHLRAMGGLFQKGGQTMAVIANYLNPTVARALQESQMQTTPLEPDVARRILNEEWGRPVEDLVESWPDYPIASASFGHVYRARLRDGRSVAVKIIHPDALRSVKSDQMSLKVISPFLKLAFPGVDIRGILEEVHTALVRECNYGVEAANQNEVRALFAGEGRFAVPEVVSSLSTNKVLVSTFFDGLNLYQFARAANQNLKTEALKAIIYAKNVLLYRHGIVDHDPHPGNYLFGSGKICFVDFGGYSRLKPETVQLLKALYLAMDDNDLGAFASVMNEIGYAGKGFEPKAALHALRVLNAGVLRDVEPLDIEEGLAPMVAIHKTLRLPPELTAIFRMQALLINVSQVLDPKARFEDLMRPLMVEDPAEMSAAS